MSVSGFERSASLDTTIANPQGQIRMSFLWHGFGRTSDDRVVVGDVFEGQFYIGPNQWLVFQTGPNLSFVADEVDPLPDVNSSTSIADSDTVTWKGERRFADNRPRVVFTSESQAGAQSNQAGTTTNGSSKQAGAGGTEQMVVIGLVVLVVGIGAGAAWRSGLIGTITSDEDEDGEAVTETASTGGPATGAATATDAETAPDEPAVPEEELLSDEDRVIQMLETNGGRMKQANIVDETGWSKSKVSMLLSEMEDEELISKLRVGRENIVSLSGHEPDAAGSPFDDED